MSQTFELRSDVPAPAVRRYGPRANYPFAQMQVGHVFFVPCTDAETEKVIDRLKGASARWRKQNNVPSVRFQVAATTMPDDPMATRAVGVWRVA